MDDSDNEQQDRSSMIPGLAGAAIGGGVGGVAIHSHLRNKMQPSPVLTAVKSRAETEKGQIDTALDGLKASRDGLTEGKPIQTPALSQAYLEEVLGQRDILQEELKIHQNPQKYVGPLEQEEASLRAELIKNLKSEGVAFDGLEEAVGKGDYAAIKNYIETTELDHAKAPSLGILTSAEKAINDNTKRLETLREIATRVQPEQWEAHLQALESHLGATHEALDSTAVSRDWERLVTQRMDAPHLEQRPKFLERLLGNGGQEDQWIKAANARETNLHALNGQYHDTVKALQDGVGAPRKVMLEKKLGQLRGQLEKAAAEHIGIVHGMSEDGKTLLKEVEGAAKGKGSLGKAIAGGAVVAAVAGLGAQALFGRAERPHNSHAARIRAQKAAAQPQQQQGL